MTRTGAPQVGPSSTRDEVLEALAHANATAKRLLRHNALGVENPAWARVHAYINFLLSLLED